MSTRNPLTVANGTLKSNALPRFTPGGTGATITDIVSNYQNLPSRIELDLAGSVHTGVIEYCHDTEGRQISRWSWEEDPAGAKVAGTEGNEWSYYDALGRLDARVGVDGDVLDQRLVNLLTEYTDPPNEPGLWLRSQFHPANEPNDPADSAGLPLPGTLTHTWSTYGARGLVAHTHGPMTGIQPLASDVLHEEIVLNDHLGSPRLRLESQHQPLLGGEDRDIELIDVVVSGWMPKNPMDYTPFGRELALSSDSKTTPGGYTGKPLDTTFGLN